MWPILGALATTYFVRRSRQNGQAGRRIFTMADGSRKSTMGSIANVGRAVLETTMRAVQKR